MGASLTGNGVQKVSPNMTMKEVLSDYCSDKGLDVNGYALVHNRKNVDLSLPWRLTALPNNVTLFVEARKQGAGATVVNLALQLEDGSRLQNKFPVTSSLWQVLLSFESGSEAQNFTRRMGPEPQPEKSMFGRLSDKLTGHTSPRGPQGWFQPVVVLLNKRFASVEELCATTLQSLGLVSGTALARVTFEWTNRPEPPKTDQAPAQPVQVHAVAPKSAAATVPPALSGGEDGEGRLSKRERLEDADHPALEEPQGAPQVEIAADRDFVVFEPSDTPFNPANYEIPDDFYNLGPHDLAALKSAAGKAGDEFLMTREFREKKALQPYLKFTKTNIRVRFPDRWELQGTFLATETSADLYVFVCQYVVDAERPFELYTTPPRHILDPESFLKQKLVPAAVVYFAWVGERNSDDTYLSADAKAAATKLGSSGKHLTTFSNTKPIEYDLSVASDSQADPNDKGKQDATAAAAGGKKVPAWLKFGKK